jgi:hypothetical protein
MFCTSASIPETNDCVDKDFTESLYSNNFRAKAKGHAACALTGPHTWRATCALFCRVWAMVLVCCLCSSPLVVESACATCVQGLSGTVHVNDDMPMLLYVTPLERENMRWTQQGRAKADKESTLSAYAREDSM